VTRAAGLLALWLAASGIAVPAGAASRFDPSLRFRALRTEHFVIYFHSGEERVAARLASIAEDVWAQFTPMPGTRAPGRMHVVLVDQSDASNGYASPLPYNTIVIHAAWPRGSEFIGNTDDWLRMVFTHELAHIFHLDRSRGWAEAVRRVFGRVPVAFPNLFLPAFLVEGLATFREGGSRALAVRRGFAGHDGGRHRGPRAVLRRRRFPAGLRTRPG
jgi:hypothetical protein